MYCPRQNSVITEKSKPINIGGSQTRSVEYSLTNHCGGPISSSPPNMWCQRLQSRYESY